MASEPPEDIMKRLSAALVVIGAVLVLAGCAGNTQPRATVTVTAAAAPSPAPTTAPPIASINDAPLCATLVGKPTALAVDPTGNIHCVFATGVDGATVAKIGPCNVLDGTGPMVWGWFNPDTTTGDQTVYAGKDNGTIVIAADNDGAVTIAGTYYRAVGCL